jgi:hypothetical protein
MPKALPNELWREVFAYLATRDLLSVCFLNHAFLALARVSLYSALVLEPEEPLLRRLVRKLTRTNPMLRFAVRSVEWKASDIAYHPYKRKFFHWIVGGLNPTQQAIAQALAAFNAIPGVVEGPAQYVAPPHGPEAHDTLFAFSEYVAYTRPPYRLGLEDESSVHKYNYEPVAPDTRVNVAALRDLDRQREAEIQRYRMDCDLVDSLTWRLNHNNPSHAELSKYQKMLDDTREAIGYARE